MARVIAYIDGFNLYYGLRTRGWHQFYWIDPYRLIQAVLPTNHEIVAVKYFTARVRGPQDKRDRQTAYLDAINAVSQAERIDGKYYRKPRKCYAPNGCGGVWPDNEEKMTDSAMASHDSAMASHIVADAFLDLFDAALLVSGDTDIVPPIKMVRRHFPLKRFIARFPPARRNDEVARHCDDEQVVNGLHLAAAVMPDKIEVSPGVYVQRPESWQTRPTADPEKPAASTTAETTQGPTGLFDAPPSATPKG